MKNMKKVLEGKSYPIDEILPRIKETVLASPSAVLQAPPGSGKTTRTPLALRVSLKSPDSNRIYRDSFPQPVADSDVVEAAETAHDRLRSGQVARVSVERPAESREDDIGGGDA
jgi:hypothetical protein